MVLFEKDLTYCAICQKDITKGYYVIHKRTKTHQRLESAKSSCKHCREEFGTFDSVKRIRCECGGHYSIEINPYSIETGECCHCGNRRDILQCVSVI